MAIRQIWVLRSGHDRETLLAVLQAFTVQGESPFVTPWTQQNAPGLHGHGKAERGPRCNPGGPTRFDGTFHTDLEPTFIGYYGLTVLGQ